MFAAGVSERHGRCRLARVRQTRFLAAICCTGSDASISFPILLRSEFLHVSVALRISPLERFSRLRWRQGDSTVCHDYVSSVTARFSLSKLKDIEKICAAHTCILEKAQINAHLRDFCFLSGFSPHERNCTTLGIFALCAFWSQHYKRILPGNKRKYPGKKRKCPSVKKQMRVFWFKWA